MTTRSTVATVLLTLFGSAAPLRAQDLRINEVVASNTSTLADEDGDYPDWIELYNAGASSVNVQGYGLSDDESEPFKWTFPSASLAPAGHVLVFASGKERPLHASFRLDADGESIYLTAPDGRTIDSLAYDELPADVSIGRSPDGRDTWLLFDRPTPGSANEEAGFTGVTERPVLSQPSGFYSSNAVVVTIAADPGDEIHYTLDGSEPTLLSPRYRTPLAFTKTTVLRGRAFRPGHLPGPIATATYLIQEDLHLPVVSLATEPENLWDWETGIYVLGPNAQPQSPNWGANFWQDWEIPVHLALIHPGASSPAFELDAGAAVYGGWSRAHPQKSLAIYARPGYGASAIRYPVFDEKPLDSFQSIVLRNSGNDWYNTLFRDALMQRLVKDTAVDMLAYRPAAVFLNGEYWGIQNIREKVSEHYVAGNHGVGEIDMVEVLRAPEKYRTLHGSDEHYQAFLGYLEQSAMTAPEDFDYVEAAIDVENFIDYHIAQIFFGNTDWPGNNVKIWRPRTPDGRWRWILYDTDFGFGLYNSDPRQETLVFATATNGPEWPNPPHSTFVLRRLLLNEQFRHAFINRFADLLNGDLNPIHTLPLIKSFQEGIASEMPRHLARWNRGSVSQWLSEVRRLEDFAVRRPSPMRSQLRDFFDLGGEVSLRLDAVPAGAGSIRINRLDLDTFPWTGRYYPGIPVMVEARPRPGYRFTGWSGDVSGTERVSTIDPATASNVTAMFETDPTAPAQIVLNEIQYAPAAGLDSEDWVELINLDPADVDLGGWTLLDDDDAHRFVLPPGTLIPGGGYLVLCRDAAAFEAVYHHSCVGGWDFGLSAGGDQVRLLTEGGILVDSVRFDDQSPWPTAAGGSGSSLELIDPADANDQAVHWRASKQIGGTPGQPNSISVSVDEAFDVPSSAALLEAYPNPFSDFLTLRYAVDRPGHVSLRVYDLLGRSVAVPVDGVHSTGVFEVRLEGAGLPAGVYICRLETETGRDMSMVVLAR